MVKKCYLHAVQTYRKIAHFGMCKKSAVDQKNLKLGEVITWVISNVKKNIFVVTATCLEEVNLLTLKGLYSM